MRHRLGIGRAPLLGRGAGDGVLGEAVEDLRREAGDDLLALPVAHPVDPDDQAAGGEAAEVVVALDERDLGAQARGGDRRRAAGRAAADDEDVGLLVDRRLARGLVDRALGPGVLVVRRALRALGEPALAAEVVLLVLEVPPAGVVVRHGVAYGDTTGVSGNLTSVPGAA